MMKSVLFGRGYWGEIVRGIIEEETDLLLVADSKTNLNALPHVGANMAFVCSLTHSHYDVVKWCIDNGIKYIFCEKPFTGEYKKAKELLKLAKKKHVNIFIDNIFLYRSEIMELGHLDMRDSLFIWKKMDEDCKENIFDSLLYHDLYLLFWLSGEVKWGVEDVLLLNDRRLSLKMSRKRRRVGFYYNREAGSKKRGILIDGKFIDLLTPTNNPLKDSIMSFIYGDVCFETNNLMTLNVLKLMDKIKKLAQ